MKAKQKKRPGILIRLYPEDIKSLNSICGILCTPRENYCRRTIMERVNHQLQEQAAKEGVK